MDELLSTIKAGEAGLVMTSRGACERFANCKTNNLHNICLNLFSNAGKDTSVAGYRQHLKKDPQSQRKDETGGLSVRFEISRYENLSPKLGAVWFAMIMASIGILYPILPTISLIGSLPGG